jgi:hypothetical protein
MSSTGEIIRGAHAAQARATRARQAKELHRARAAARVTLKEISAAHAAERDRLRASARLGVLRDPKRPPPPPAAASLMGSAANARQGSGLDTDSPATDRATREYLFWRTRPDVPHVCQRANWDCGLACVAMVLRAKGLCEGVDLDALGQSVGVRSVWTIDLATLLARFGVAFSFCTVLAGVNPAYRSFGFYRRSFSEDERRVQRLFAEAKGRGLAVEKRHVPLLELKRAMAAGQTLAVALVDARLLRGRPWFQWLARKVAPFTGHYILLHSYCPDRDCFYYRDPARRATHVAQRGSKGKEGEVGPRTAPRTFSIGARDLQRARTSAGTDEDILLIPHAAVATAALVPGGAAAGEAPLAAARVGSPAGRAGAPAGAAATAAARRRARAVAGVERARARAATGPRAATGGAPPSPPRSGLKALGAQSKPPGGAVTDAIAAYRRAATQKEDR